MKKPKLDDLKIFLITAAGLLLWAPFTSSVFGWYGLSMALSISFFLIMGLAIVTSVFSFIRNQKNSSLFIHIAQWLFLFLGLILIVIGMAIMDFEPVFTVVFSLPLVRLMSSRSITDFLKEDHGTLYPWMNRISDALFLVSAILFGLMFFGRFDSPLISVLFICLGLSLGLDQLHFGLNQKDWKMASGMIAVAIMVFLVPGIAILIFG